MKGLVVIIQSDLISNLCWCARVGVHGGCTWYVPLCVRVARVHVGVCVCARACRRACARAYIHVCVCVHMRVQVCNRCLSEKATHALQTGPLKSLNCHAISSSSYSIVTIVIIDHHRHRGRHHHNLSMQQHSSKHLSSVRQLYVQGFLRIRNIVEV